ncbi:hypothetical protein GE061_013534, partial [Apolygus lucorum]
MPEQLAIITGCMAQLAEGLRTNISRMDQINRALTRDVATLRYQTRAQQDHSETDSDHGEPCEPDTSRQSDMQERPVTTTPEPPESAHRIGDEPVDQEEQHPERAVPPYPPLSPAPPPTLRGSAPELKLCACSICNWNRLVARCKKHQMGHPADLFEEMPEQLAIITGCMAQLAEGLRTNISRMDQINRALTRDVATLRYQTRAQQDHSETDSDHGEPCEPDTSRQSDMQERPVTTTPEPPESAHRIGDEPVDQEEQHPERAVPPYPPLSPAPPPTLRGSAPEL